MYLVFPGVASYFDSFFFFLCEYLRILIDFIIETVFDPTAIRCLQDLYSWEDQALDSMDTTLALEQHIQQMIRKDAAQIDAIIALPENYEETIWQYEHMRLVMMIMVVVVMLLIIMTLSCFPRDCTELSNSLLVVNGCMCSHFSSGNSVWSSATCAWRCCRRARRNPAP